MLLHKHLALTCPCSFASLAAGFMSMAWRSHGKNNEDLVNQLKGSLFENVFLYTFVLSLMFVYLLQLLAWNLAN